MDTPAIKQIVRESDPNLDERTKDFHAAVVLLAMLEVGPHERQLMHFTGYGIFTIRHLLDNWKKNGVIDGEIICHGGWDDPEDGAVAFWLDVGVGTGVFERD